MGDQSLSILGESESYGAALLFEKFAHFSLTDTRQGQNLFTKLPIAGKSNEEPSQTKNRRIACFATKPVT